MLGGVAINARVGLFRRRFEGDGEAVRITRRRLAPAMLEFVEHDRDRHLAGDLAGRGAAHSVGDHEQRALGASDVRAHIGPEGRVPGGEIGDNEGVFVVLARPPDVGFAEDVDDDLAVAAGGMSVHEVVVT